jgi:RecB family exonuclease
VSVRLPGDRTVRCRGRIDRIDSSPQGFDIWDYKSGRAPSGRDDDPFDQGRRVQNILYVLMVEARLAAARMAGHVRSFGYFYPGREEHGLRTQWPAARLEGGREVLARLCEMIAAGAFPPADEDRENLRSDFAAAFGDADAAAGAMKRKLANLENAALAPMRELKGFDP